MWELLNQYGTTGNQGKPDENGIYTQNSTINGKEETAFNPTIPKGFRPINEEPANWGNGTMPPSEEAVKAGLIIQDAEGNEIVWIAVDRENVKLDRYSFTSDGSQTAQGENVISNNYQELVNSDKGNATAKEIDVFKTSVAEHGGYYIARYEASYGIDRKPNSKVSTGTPSTGDGVAYAPSMEGQLWNNITQLDAAMACRNMYDENYGVTSDLMNSYAWDTAIVFIQKYSGDDKYATQNSLNTILANTGENGDEKCHIHDMASNCLELSTETSMQSGYPCVSRGGSYCGTGYYVAERQTKNATLGGPMYSFRPILYF